jgi:Glyoxalase superfamily protein
MIIMDFNFTRVVPVLRIFDIVKADEFYLGFLGFSVDWDHRFAPDAPLYRQISWSNLILHLSEHHGDGSPGARIRVMMDGIEAFHHEISSKGYAICGPDSNYALGDARDWGDRSLRQSHPFLPANRASGREDFDLKPFALDYILSTK